MMCSKEILKIGNLFVSELDWKMKYLNGMDENQGITGRWMAMEIVNQVLEWVMAKCYAMCHNYGYAIILFTFLSKIVLLPLSVWVQKNSIKMVKMQPEMNFIKAKYFGDKDTIAEEQSKIFKREKYNPFISVVPLAVQIVLLLGLVHAIQEGIRDPGIDMDFYGLRLSLVPDDTGGALLLSPILAGLSAWVLCAAQNAGNVLQAEQSKLNKYGMMLLSIALSVYLGWFVPVGVALYWIASNLMAVAQLYLLNWLINPKDFIDYGQLEKSRQALEGLEHIGGKKKRHFHDEESRRERADYQRFFSVVNKHLVFYSESSGFYKYYQGMIEYLLSHTNIHIHYVTSDPKDAVFELGRTQKQLKTYYIGEKKLITLMMKMDADVVVMTMPDLESYHIKRSYVREDIEYIYVPHGMGSNNLTLRKAALDHFDTVFCTGKHQKEEVEKTEAAYGLPKKRTVEFGYPLLDRMRKDYADKRRQPENAHREKTVLVAPSWQKDNIMDNCLSEILESLRGKGYRVIVRPHPQHVRHQPDKMERLKERFDKDEEIQIQTDFSSNSTVFEADVVITDWSDIAYEYAFTTCRPVLFVNTPMKVMNPEYQKITVEPFNIWMREEIGKVLEPERAAQAAGVVEELFASMEYYHEKIAALADAYVYHAGGSAKVGAEYIIGQIQKKAKERKKGKTL